jgi:hypothetical protein
LLCVGPAGLVLKEIIVCDSTALVGDTIPISLGATVCTANDQDCIAGTLQAVVTNPSVGFCNSSQGVPQSGSTDCGGSTPIFCRLPTTCTFTAPAPDGVFINVYQNGVGQGALFICVLVSVAWHATVSMVPRISAGMGPRSCSQISGVVLKTGPGAEGHHNLHNVHSWFYEACVFMCVGRKGGRKEGSW